MADWESRCLGDQYIPLFSVKINGDWKPSYLAKEPYRLRIDAISRAKEACIQYLLENNLEFFLWHSSQ